MDHSEKVIGRTNGEKIVGLGFNPSSDGYVSHVKLSIASIIDYIESEFNNQETYPIQEEVKRQAIIKLLEAQMLAVKALYIQGDLT